MSLGIKWLLCLNNHIQVSLFNCSKEYNLEKEAREMHVHAISCLTNSASGQSLYKNTLCFQEETISIFNTSSKVTGMDVVCENSAEFELVS